MSARPFDIAIIGSGFGGSLLALILRRLDYRVVVIDRAKHPRFAIGESSTPLADSILKSLAERYDLPSIGHLSSYGTAKANLPDVVVGLKRGFSYFRHHRGEHFDAASPHPEQLVVAASAGDSFSDTHWLRSDVDAFIASQLEGEGIAFFDESHISSIQKQHAWRIEFRRQTTTHKIDAQFVIDASGSAGVLLNALGVGCASREFLTNSYAIYAHFVDAKPWHDVFVQAGGDATVHPFRCDRAAVHHLIDNGWMWQLGFDNDVMSAGFVLKGDAWQHLIGGNPVDQWRMLCDQYPTLADQFATARVVAASPGMIATNRLQFLAEKLSGDAWTLLPGTAGFVDPMHSTGIAHTLSAIERLAEIFSRNKPGESDFVASIGRYAAALERELMHIDRLVSACYQSIDDFDSFVAATMLYFAAATFSEHRRHQASGSTHDSNGFLLADDKDFREIVKKSLALIDEDRSRHRSSYSGEKRFPTLVGSMIAPYNLAGLCDQSVQNMYRYTAAPEKT